MLGIMTQVTNMTGQQAGCHLLEPSSQGFSLSLFSDLSLPCSEKKDVGRELGGGDGMCHIIIDLLLWSRCSKVPISMASGEKGTNPPLL